MGVVTVRDVYREFSEKEPLEEQGKHFLYRSLCIEDHAHIRFVGGAYRRESEEFQIVRSIHVPTASKFSLRGSESLPRQPWRVVTCTTSLATTSDQT